MIVVDIETTGLNPKKNQMVSIGAVDYETGETFYGECRIYKNDEINTQALEVNGFTEKDVRDNSKLTSKKLYEQFVDWSSKRSKMLAGCVVDFDISFLKSIHERTQGDREFPFYYRSIDLHSVAYGKFGKSMGLKSICETVGVEPEPDVHNALNGAMKAYECLKIML